MAKERGGIEFPIRTAYDPSGEQEVLSGIQRTRDKADEILNRRGSKAGLDNAAKASEKQAAAAQKAARTTAQSARQSAKIAREEAKETSRLQQSLLNRYKVAVKDVAARQKKNAEEIAKAQEYYLNRYRIATQGTAARQKQDAAELAKAQSYYLSRYQQAVKDVSRQQKKDAADLAKSQKYYLDRYSVAMKDAAAQQKKQAAEAKEVANRQQQLVARYDSVVKSDAANQKKEAQELEEIQKQYLRRYKQAVDDQKRIVKAREQAEREEAKETARIRQDLLKRYNLAVKDSAARQKKEAQELAKNQAYYLNRYNTVVKDDKAAQVAADKLAAEKKKKEDAALKLRRQAIAAKEAADRQELLNKQQDRYVRGGGQVVATARRIITAFIGYEVLRKVTGLFRELVSTGVDFNRQIESNELGVASLILALGKLSDANGKALDPSVGLKQARIAARKQLELLRKDALQTQATFEELAKAFQSALGPGLTAGFDIDQVRKFTVSVSQAAAAIELPQDQLLEEVRSILAGTINARTTRIAATLGITNEDIRRYKEAGTLFENLEQRFSAFAAAGEEVSNTFTGIVARLTDASRLLLGDASTGFFDSLKADLQDVIDLAAPKNERGLLEPSPEASAVLREIFGLLTDIKDLSIEFARSFFTTAGTARDLAYSIRVVTVGAFKVLLDLVGGIIRGFGQATKIVLSMAKAILGPVAGIEAFQDGTESVVKGIGYLIGLMLALKIATLAVSTAWTLGTSIPLAARGVGLLITGFREMVNLLKIARATSLAVAANTALAAFPVTAIVVAIVAIVAALAGGVLLLKKWYENIFGVQLKFESFVEIVKTDIGAILLKVERFFSRIKAFTDNNRRVFESTIKYIWKVLIPQAVNKILDQIQPIINILAFVNEAAAKGAQSLSDGLRTDESDIRQAVSDYAEEVKKNQEEYQKAVDKINTAAQDADAYAEKRFQEIIDNDSNAESFTDILKRRAGEIGDSLGIGNFLRAPDGSDLAESIADSVDNFGAALSGAEGPADRIQEAFKGVREEIEGASSELGRLRAEVAGSVGGLRDSRIDVQYQDAIIDREKQRTKINEELVAARRTVEQSRETEAIAQGRLNELTDGERAAVEKILDLRQRLLDAQKAEKDASVDLAQANIKIADAQEVLNKAAAEKADIERGQAKKKLETSQQTISYLREQLNAIELEGEARARVLSIAEGLVVTSGRLNASQQAFVEGSEAAADVLKEINRTYLDRLEIVELERRQQLLSAQRQSEQSLVELALAQRLRDERITTAQAIKGDLENQIFLIRRAQEEIKKQQKASTEAGAARISQIETERDKTREFFNQQRDLIAERQRALKDQVFKVDISADDAADQIAAIHKELESLYDSDIRLQQESLSLQDRTNKAKTESVKNSALELAALEQQNQALEIQAKQYEKILERREEILRRPISTGIGDGVRDGLDAIGGDSGSPIYETFRNVFSTLVADFGYNVADAFQAALVASIEGGSEEVRAALLNIVAGLAQDIAREILAGIINAGVQRLLSSFLKGPELGAQAAAAGATNAAAAALGTASSALFAASTALSASAVQITTAAQILAASRAGGIGLYKGGLVADAFRNARGYAAGGAPQASKRKIPAPIPRPSHLHPRDTVPAWLDPREVIITGKRVEQWGVRNLLAFNNGDPEPLLLQMLVGGASRRTGRIAARARTFANAQGFAEGGTPALPVGGNGQPRVSRALTQALGNQRPQMLPVVPFSERTYGQITYDNADTILEILRAKGVQV